MQQDSSSAKLWYNVIGDSDDEDSEFEGFTEADLLKIDPADGESDIDIDFEAVQDEFDDDDRDDDFNVDDLPRLPCGDWSTQLHSVSDDTFTENVGVCHDLGVGAEPLEYFQLFFPDSVFTTIATETNQYAEQVQAEKRLDSKWHPTTAEEMKLYIAINVMMGIHILVH